jgi:hypothetical protein
MQHDRLNNIIFWYKLGQKAFHVGCKLGAVRVKPLSLEWNSWRAGWMTEYDKSRVK